MTTALTVGQSQVVAQTLTSSRSNALSETETLDLSVLSMDSLKPELPELDATALLQDATREIHLLLKLSERRLYVYEGDKVKHSFPVAVGKPGWETPTGDFQVLRKDKDPIFMDPFSGRTMPPGPGNPLGDRAIDFWTNGVHYASFHGTTREELIGQAVSHGCVRMKNADVRVLFDLVKVGTTVVVES